MKQIQLVHNPTAGDEAHSKEKLLAQIERAGFACRYTSTKEIDWKEKIYENSDMIVVAGGDGTVRKVVKQVLKKEAVAKNIPLAVLAMGTANNIARSLNIADDTVTAIHTWKKSRLKKVGIGELKNVTEESFFLEGFGYGIFPQLMETMKEKEEQYDTPEEELKGALKTLHNILMNYKPRHCRLEVDGTDHSGEFFMVEVMNIRSIGPNLELAPFADPGDDVFEVVLIPEAHKEKFAGYLQHKLKDDEDFYQFPTLRGKKITLSWDGTWLHVDDQLLKQEKEKEVCITIKEGALQFLVPEDEPAHR